MFKKTVLLLALAGASLTTLAAELRVMTHSSFSLPKERIAEFEKQSGAKLAIIKGGDAGEMLNKLILTRANPVADVVYGIDNTLIGKANAAGVLEAESRKDKGEQAYRYLQEQHDIEVFRQEYLDLIDSGLEQARKEQP